MKIIYLCSFLLLLHQICSLSPIEAQTKQFPDLNVDYSTTYQIQNISETR